MEKQSLWRDTAPSPKCGPLQGDVNVDVLVVGGGITGLTTAYLLLKEGCSVAVVDIQEIGGGETANTTAHVTFVTDSRLSELVSEVGRDKARALWYAGLAAMEQIESLVHELEIDCELRRVPGYLFAALGKDEEHEAQSLRKEAALASELGFDAEFIRFDPLFNRPAVRFPNQMKFHPLKYINGLAKAVSQAGGHLFSRTSGSDIDSEKHELRSDGGKITYETLVAATHVPIQGERGTFGAALFQTKLAAYSTYAIEAEIEKVSEALFWDTNDPYLYLRIDARDDRHFVIFGGEDHKTGQEGNTEARYDKLTQTLKEMFPKATPLRRWSGQVLETPDGMPYIGEVGERQFLATGFAGNGMTLGTFSGMVLRDLIAGRENHWSRLYDPNRKVIAGMWDYFIENKDYPLYLVKRHLSPASKESPPRCSGAIVKVNGKKQAVYIDEHGKETRLNPICPHMGCIVAWNDGEKTWDCPCHGSRFTSDGKMMTGPAESDLAAVE